ncbi:hypothetical protein [Sinorhizobium medicae]|uniref:hypothetical protein n=1 Tax=Sinorhizobium medicae TaxID=110321 RepID=UPI000FD9020A|nr:hypothetical protein [Sinorhizobium medicae]RVJ38504.1 hypothetical protein CN180_22230 [Sinorhizobium medicae]
MLYNPLCTITLATCIALLITGRATAQDTEKPVEPGFVSNEPDYAKNPISIYKACDPNEILRSDISNFNENITVWLSYIKNLQQSVEQGQASSAGISYAGVGLSYEDAKSFASYIVQNENYNLATSESVSILRTTLSPDSVAAYIACLKANDPLTIVAPDTAIGEIEFPLTVRWAPGFEVPGSTLKVTLINGTIEGKKVFEKKVDPPEEISLTILRNGKGDKRLFITAEVNGKVSDTFTYPAIPMFKVDMQRSFSPPRDKLPYSICRSGHCGTDKVVKDLCIYASGGGTLLPSTQGFEVSQIVGDPNRAKWYQKKGNSSGVSCAVVENSAGASEHYNFIAGWATVMQAVTVPIDEDALPKFVKDSYRRIPIGASR